MAVHIRKSWQLSERELTSEKFFRQRRQLVKSAGLIGLGLAGGLISACGPAGDAIRLGAQEQPAAADLYPARRNPQFILDRPVTDEAHAASYNNFYEFSVFKSRVYKNTARLTTHPWQVEIAGLVAKPRVYDIDELVRSMGLEERLYRFRCVEAWAMAVPWSGFPLAALIKKVEPLSAAKFIRLVTFLKPDQATNQSPSYGPWPYSEALTMAEP